MVKPQDPRRNELAQIHVAKKQLGLDDETYRAMLWSVARVRSSADLDFAGRKAVLDHLKAKGFKPQAPKADKGRSEWAFVFQAAPDRQPSLKKIYRLTQALGGKSKAYVEAIARKMAGADQPLEFCEAARLHQIVQALEIQKRRQS